LVQAPFELGLTWQYFLFSRWYSRRASEYAQ